MTRRMGTEQAPMWRLLAVVVAVLAVAAGCGDPLGDKLESSGKQPYSDDDPSLVDGDAATTVPPADAAAVARQAFVGEIERSCASRNQQLAASSINQGLAGSPQDALQVLSRMVGALETTAAVLRDRTPPPGDEATVAELIGGLDHFAGLMRPVIDAGGWRSEGERDALLATLETDGAVITARFDAYGLPSCF